MDSNNKIKFKGKDYDILTIKDFMDAQKNIIIKRNIFLSLFLKDKIREPTTMEVSKIILDKLILKYPELNKMCMVDCAKLIEKLTMVKK